MKKIITTWFFLVLLASIVSAQRPEMIYVEGGSFYMGNDYSGGMDEKPEHKVTLNDFYISKYEVTFEMFDNFCNSSGYPKANDGGYGRGKKPVINVSWEGAVKFCNWLSSKFGYEKVYDIKVDSAGMVIRGVNWDADGFRLPTEAEWEYVARGGSKTQGYSYAGSNDPKSVAWFAENSENTPHDVGTKSPNELNIYDLLGNAWEWCWDFYDPSYYANSPEDNPRGPASGNNRVFRGGNFESKADFIRLTKRFQLPISLNSGLVGIRLVQNKSAKQP